jgi:hypothetical protein
MSDIHFIGGEKGGVGKSVLTRVIAQFCIDRGIPFVGYDTDRSHGSFTRFYRDYASPVLIDSFASIDGIVETLCADPSRHALVDLAAQTLRPLQAWIEASGMTELLAEQQHRAVFWHVMDGTKDSLLTLETLLAAFGPSVSYVIVLNHGRGGSFEAVESSAAYASALALGAKVINLQRLHDATMRKIDQSDASFWSATHRGDGGNALGLLERQRVKVWLRRTYQDLEAIIGKP